MKRVLIFCLFALFIGLFPKMAYGSDIRLIIDGQELHYMSSPPIMMDNRVMVPARDVFERVGGIIGWHEGHRQVTVFLGDDVLVMTVGLREANLNGQSIMMPVAPVVRNDRTLIPLRFPAEAFGLDVDWCDDDRTAFVNSKDNGESQEEDDDLPGSGLPPLSGLPLIPPPSPDNEPSYEAESDKEELPWEGAPNELPPPGATIITPEDNDPDLARSVSTAPIQTIPHPSLDQKYRLD